MDALEQLLKVKPVPENKISTQVKQKKQVEIKTTIIDNRKSGYDRKALRKKMLERGLMASITRTVPKSKPQSIMSSNAPSIAPITSTQSGLKKKLKRRSNIRIKSIGTKEIVIDTVADPTMNQVGSVTVKRLKKKLKISNKISKGTITSFADPLTEKFVIKTTRKLPQVPEEQMVLLDLKNRLPEQEPVIKIKSNSYYLNNRQIFINFINSLFSPYRDSILAESAESVSCDSKSDGFSLMTHQEIVRDYINLYTPYRGLLIYHGLGAGKTCASIGIAEGLKHDKQVIIMTPASLRRNYQNELKTCGDMLYRVNQFWEFITTQDINTIKALAVSLSLSETFIKKAGGAWVTDIRKPANFDSLTPEKRFSLNKQVDEMIRSKYSFINYNGLRTSHLDSLSNNGSINPFDNKVIIIDEVHNFVGRIANKIGKKKASDSLSLRLYEYLLSAQNTRLVFLTGTPIINYPNEIGILFNMLRGYIKTFVLYVNVETSSRVNQETIEEILKPLKVADYINYDNASKTISITRNPFEYISQYDDRVYNGVKKNKGWNVCQENRDCEGGFTCTEKKCQAMTDESFIKIVSDMLRKKNIQTLKVDRKSYTALPDTAEKFNNMFIEQKSAIGEMKNQMLFKMRILGLTSYFRSAREELMPRHDIDKDMIIEEIEMSNYQFGVYETARVSERSQETRNARKRKQGGDDIYGDSSSTYRIFSRAFCNYVFPQEVGRPMPQEDSDVNTILNKETGELGDEDLLDGASVAEKLQNPDGKYELDDTKSLQLQVGKLQDSSYPARISRALEALEINGDKYLSVKGLSIYSPKFLTMYENIISDSNKGLHLVYSQFRTLEGIGIFELVLKYNGFVKFKLKKTDSGYDIDMNEEDIGKPAFALYTGTEETEEKDIVRRIFNGEWDSIPQNIAEKLRKVSTDNKMGELIKVFMITSSGAEGITLKNCRFVHIVEPYWHPVRVEQVIGRARRICSHKDLPKEYQNVTVFMYLMKFSEEQMVPVALEGMASKDLLKKDVSKIDKVTPFTSDQALFEISNIKSNINKQILSAVKSSSIDCALHSRAGDDDDVVCMAFGQVDSTRFTTKPALTIESEFDKIRSQNMKKIKWKASEITLGGKIYAFRAKYKDASGKKGKIGFIYDLESYQVAKKRGGNPILKGKIVFTKEKRLEFIEI